ncbi:MAG TPA: anhydro-N-acetylmuramic acid kinase [Candidatus Dormibacteraeota bacterium]|nr:anhydro-N-acetylmuramic acid kinase [Candidatus Dormibacteraeota bacterium]
MSKIDKPMRVLGMMSGTSVDGIDVAAVKLSGAPPNLSAQLEAHHHVKFPAGIRDRILYIAEGSAATTADLSELNFLLGEQFARAALDACKKWRVAPRNFSLIGSHGQTIFHLGAAVRFRGRLRTPSTLQIGDISVIAQRTGITTVGDFRPADMAAGGQGAPLVPFVDYLIYRHDRLGRVALNIGGIANVTVIPASARPEKIFAFDTGPGNMIVDALVNRITHGKQKFDRDARIAIGGRVLPDLLARLMRDAYLRKRPPKSAGREQFGQQYVQNLLAWGKQHRSRPEDLVRTATVFTSLSIAYAFRRFIMPRAKVDELIITGGGARNLLIVAQLAAAIPGVEILSADRFGVPVEAKEAFAFAILAYETYHRRANNLPSATGARRPVILGKIAYANGSESGE